MTNLKKVVVAAVVAVVAANYKEDFSEPISTCPSGYEFNGKECTRTRLTEPRTQCPKGYQLDKKGCVASQIVRSEPVCPEGFQISPAGGKKGGAPTCIRSDEIEPIPTCPIGYEDTGSGCQQDSSAAITFTKVPRFEECAPEYSCPKGSMNDGKECVSEITLDKTVTTEVITEPCPNSNGCPPGFSHVDGGSGKGGDAPCEKVEVRPKLERQVTEIQDCEVDIQCPKGAVPHGDSCVLEQRSEKIVQHVSNTEACEPSPFCPAGSVDTGSGCEVQRTVQKVSVQNKGNNIIPAEYRCPSGGEPDEKTGLCASSYSVEPIRTVQVDVVPCKSEIVCPKGYSQSFDDKSGGQCVMNDIRPAITTPSTQVVPCESVALCPPGAEDDGQGSCVLTSSVPYTTSFIEVPAECPTYQTCPKGSQDLGGGVCVIQHQVPAEKDCQQIPLPPSDSKEPSYDSDIKGGNGKEAAQPIEYELQCTEVCPKGTESLGKGVCGSQEQVPAITQCAPGCSQSGGKGGASDSKSGQCSGVERQQVQECPKGFTDTGKGCERTESIPAIEGCPKGCTAGGDGKGAASFGGKGGKSGECTRVETLYNAECPKGYEPVGDISKGGKGALCQATLSTDPLEVCPAECSKSTGKGKSGKGKGFVDEGCVRVETTPVITCPKGYVEGPGKATTGKPKGSSGGTCISEAQVPPVPYCPKGSTPTKDGNCIDSSAQNVKECPKGSEDIGKAGCLERHNVPYQLTCPKGCQEVKSKGKGKGKGFEAPTCFSMESSIVETCPKGYEDDGKGCVLTRSIPPTSVCPKDCQSAGKGGKKSKGKGFQGDSCFRISSNTVFECPKGFEDNGKECVATVTTGFSDACPKGCQPSGKGGKGGATCVSTTVVPVESCPKGSEDTGKSCRSVTSSAPIPVCPKGCQQSAGKGKGMGPSCFTIQYEEVPSCPKGFSGKGGKGKGTESCQSNDIAPYRFECPKGYNPVHDSKGSKGQGPIVACRKFDIAPADVSCPKGTDPVGSSKGKGMKGADSGLTCQSRDYVDPDLFCDKGGNLTDKGCEVIDVVDPIISAPPKGKGMPSYPSDSKQSYPEPPPAEKKF